MYVRFEWSFDVQFHYNYIKNKYGSKSRLLFTKADSLIHEIETQDVYKDLSKDEKSVCFSNYSAKTKIMLD